MRAAPSEKREFTLVYGDHDEERWTNPWPNDGITYKSCWRCGINMRLDDTSEPRKYCVDCDYPVFRAPFEAGRAIDYLSVAAA